MVGGDKHIDEDSLSTNGTAEEVALKLRSTGHFQYHPFWPRLDLMCLLP